MTDLLLTTKLRAPSATAGAIPRPRLIQRLRQGLEGGRRLTLVSAPAGYGKTTLAIGWLRDVDRPLAWLSLDAADDDPARFGRYLIAALQQASPPVGARALDALGGSPAAPLEAAFAALINDLDAMEAGCVLALDDYHLLAQPAIHQAMAFLVDHLPSRVHLALLTRADPPLPLERWRARGQMTEVREVDLAFTPQEATLYLNESMALALDAADAARLHERTEGWITGLQLASLSLLRRSAAERRAFIQSFGAEHRHVAGYLVDEVLAQQPEPVRAFLLRSSVLDKLCASLCEAVCAGDECGLGQAMLERLHAEGLFLVALDDVGRWYRYHHLFGELLRSRLASAEPDLAPELHRRASEWFEAHGLGDEAIDHALAAEEPARARRLLEAHGEAFLARGDLRRLRGWMERLPKPELHASRQLLYTLAGALTAMEAYLEAEAVIAELDDMTCGQTEDSPAFDTRGMRAYIALARGDTAATQAGLRALAGESSAATAERLYLLGRATLYADGGVPDAIRILTQAVELAEQTDSRLFLGEATAALSTALRWQGKLSQAEAACLRALHYFGEDLDAWPDKTPEVASAIVHDQYSILLYERNRLDEAEAQMERAIELAQLGGSWKLPQSYGSMAKYRLARGDPAGAYALYRSYRSFGDRFTEDMAWQKRTMDAATMLLEAALGRAGGEYAHLLAEAAQRVADSPLKPEDARDPALWFQCSYMARALVYLERPQEALAYLDPLLASSLEAGLVGRTIEHQALRAVALRYQREMGAALSALAQALRLAEPEGYVRTFLDLGEPMRALLAALYAGLHSESSVGQGVSPAYLRCLLEGFPVATVKAGPALANQTGLLEPLSERELQVLRLLALGLSSREIADQLILAVTTARTHLRNIYGKLGAHSRAEAVSRAEELGLV